MTKERILGSETEWAMLLTEEGEPKPAGFFETVSEVKRIFFESIPSPPRLASSGKKSNFYGNGSRIYTDTGTHCEYATGEVMGAKELVAHEKAGERIIERAIAGANQHPYFQERKLALRSFKNNTDRANNSYGAHENYCVLRRKIFGDCGINSTTRHLLALFRISCKLFAGNGWLKEDGGRLSYHLSQRAGELKMEVSSNTTASRAIINTRDEPHAEVFDGPREGDNPRYSRLHLIDGDALLVETALFLKFGTTSLVLDMIEDGFLSGNPFGDGDNLVDALHTFSADPTLRATALVGEKTMIDLQEFYFEKASRFCETHDSTPEQKLVLSRWGNILELAKNPEPDIALAPFVDWAAKKMLMTNKLEKLGYDWSAPSTTEIPKKIIERARQDAAESKEEVIVLPGQTPAPETKNPPTLFHVLKSMDFQFHENSPRGLARILEKNGFLKRVVTDEEIEYAVANPSQRTRALPRTLWNKTLLTDGKTPEYIDVGWTFVSYGDQNPKRVIKFPDPYDTSQRLKRS